MAKPDIDDLDLYESPHEVCGICFRPLDDPNGSYCPGECTELASKLSDQAAEAMFG